MVWMSSLQLNNLPSPNGRAVGGLQLGAEHPFDEVMSCDSDILCIIWRTAVRGTLPINHGSTDQLIVWSTPRLKSMI